MKFSWKCLLSAVCLIAITGCQELFDLLGHGHDEDPPDCEVTGITDEEEGTVADPNCIAYEWKLMDDGKRWLTENLYYEVPGSYLHPQGLEENWGRLYPWEIASTVCEETFGEGWSLPGKEDWEGLVAAYGGWSQEGEVWAFSALAYDALTYSRGDSGFDAVLGGAWYNGDFHNVGYYGLYWSATEIDADHAWLYEFDSETNLPGDQDATGSLFRESGVKFLAGSCRCVYE